MASYLHPQIALAPRPFSRNTLLNTCPRSDPRPILPVVSRDPNKPHPTATEEALATADGMSGEEISRAVADEQERQKEDAEVRDGDPRSTHIL